MGIFDIKQRPGKKYLTWEQVKVRYPRTKSYWDSDRDGFRNDVDCRPFDRNKQGIFDNIKKAIASVGMKDNESENDEYIPKKSRLRQMNEEYVEDSAPRYSEGEQDRPSGPSKKQREEAIDVSELAKQQREESEKEPQNVKRKFGGSYHKGYEKSSFRKSIEEKQIESHKLEKGDKGYIKDKYSKKFKGLGSAGEDIASAMDGINKFSGQISHKQKRADAYKELQNKLSKIGKDKKGKEIRKQLNEEFDARAKTGDLKLTAFDTAENRINKTSRKIQNISNRKYQTVRARSMSAYQTLAPVTHGYVAPRMPSKKGSKGNRTRALSVGRPRGVYKYNIPGRGPVHVYEYRKWLRRSQAMQRLQAGLPNQVQYSQYQQQYAQQRYPPVSVPPQNPYQQPQPNGRPYPEYQQQNPQIRSDNILHAPNIFKGELTNVGQNNPIISSANMNRPVSNPRGDQYIEVDPMSGKQILRTRSRERWLTRDPL
jgi:hypothetical protein